MLRRMGPFVLLLLALGCSPAPESPEARYEATVKARAWFENGDLKRAQAILSELADESRDPVAWTNLGLVQWRRGQERAAEQSWTTALQVDPQDARAHYDLGVLRQTRGHELRDEAQSNGSEKKQAESARLLALALQDFEAAAGADPTAPAIRAALAAAYADAGRHDLADKSRAEAARLDPSGTSATAEAARLIDVQVPPRPPVSTAGAITVRFRRDSLDARATGLAVADVNGDGRPDLVLAGSDVALRADSAGTGVRWTPQPVLPAGTVRAAITLLADRDDRPDVILAATLPIPDASAGAATAKPAAPPSLHTRVWLLHGGSSAPDLVADVPYEIRAWQSCDFDRDGHLDLVIATTSAPGLHVWRNDGNGRFDTEFAARGLESMPPLRDVVCGDFSGDQRPDLVAADVAGRLRVLVQTAAGAFVNTSRVAGLNLERARVVDAADMDADGTLDLLVGNENGLWLLANRGSARFVRAAAYRVPQTTYAHDRPVEVPVAGLVRFDFDNDGFEDIVTLHSRGPVIAPATNFAVGGKVMPADARGSSAGVAEDTAPEPPLPNAPRASDLALWRNSGRGVLFAAEDRLESASAPVLTGSVAAADFDLDGDLDLACVRADSVVEVQWNEGGSANGYLEISLAGPRGIQDGVGAWLEVHTGTLVQSSRITTQPVRAGIGMATRLDVVRVTWPDGAVENLIDVRVPADRILRIVRSAPGVSGP